MRQFIASFIIFFLTQTTYGQSKTVVADIQMFSEYGSKNAEVTNILQFQNIEYFRAKFAGENLKGKYFSMYCKEMWDGKVKKLDTLINSKQNPHIGRIQDDTLSLTVFGNRIEDKLKLFFKLPMVGIVHKYDAIESDAYSLRAVGVDIKIKSNVAFPAFVYMLPYERGNWKMYCAVEDSGEVVEEWGKKFKIPHYLIFEMKFDD